MKYLNREGELVESLSGSEKTREFGLKAADRRPGEFHFEQNAEGLTLSAEGWLQPVSRARTSAELNAQSVVREQGTGDLQWDAGHLIPHSLGGPGEMRNLVPMEQRANRSLVANAEDIARRELACDKPIYLRVTVGRKEGDQVPYSVRHEYFTRDASGNLAKLENGDITTRTNVRMSQTVSEAVKTHSSGSAKDFLSPSQDKGVAGHGRGH